MAEGHIKERSDAIAPKGAVAEGHYDYIYSRVAEGHVTVMITVGGGGPLIVGGGGPSYNGRRPL